MKRLGGLLKRGVAVKVYALLIKKRESHPHADEQRIEAGGDDRITADGVQRIIAKT